MKVEGEYIAVNELYGNMVGTASVSKGILYNGNVGRRALLNGIIKYDHWITTLSAEDFNMSAEGGYVSNFIKAESYGLDCKNVKHDMEVSYTPDFIQANSETSSKTHSIEVKQTKTNKVLNITCTQAAASITWTVEASLSVGSASANGGYVSTSVSWVRYRNGVRYDSGTVTPSSISGYSNGGYDSYISGTSVYVPNAGTTTSQPIVFTITGFSFYLDGEKYERTSTTYVYLGYNTYSTSIEYYISLNMPSSYVPAIGGSFTVTGASSQKRTKYTYTSGSVTYGSYSSATATLSFSSHCSSSTSSFSGTGNSFTVYVEENINSTNRMCYVYVRDGEGTTHTFSTTQYKASYEFYSNTMAAIGASGGSMTLLLTSTRNGKAYPVLSSWISVSGISGTSVNVSTVDSYYGEYRVEISNIPANTFTSARYFTITADHPVSGVDSVVWNAQQAGASQIKGKVAVRLEATYSLGKSSVDYKIYFDATNTTNYSGGTINNVQIQLSTNRNQTDGNFKPLKLYDSLSVPQGTKSATRSGSLRNLDELDVYVLVFFDNKMQYSTMPMQTPNIQE
jgi:hypothetical protein